MAFPPDSTGRRTSKLEMADLPIDTAFTTNTERHAEDSLPVLEPNVEVLRPSTWTPTSDEERRIFRNWKGFKLAERSKDTLSWVWSYGVEIQSTTSRRWICMPCVRQKATTPQSYESKGTQNAELHLWKAHGYWDPSGRRSTPSQKKGGKRVLASISDFLSLKRSDPKDQALTNSLIKRFDRGEFQKLVVNWIVESQQSFKQVEHPRLQQIFEYLNPAVNVTSAHITAKTVHSLAVQQFERYHSKVQQVLKGSPGQIHIAFDGARTRNRHALCGVTAALRDEENQPKKVVLGLPELVEPLERHSGENIATEILEHCRGKSSPAKF
ncbi:putative AC transposase [Purpureocillium lavendulum]|uniref:AC transposase n=1 Tax=Purpureocillium lavendulum TaxID=1247861 RepID=A0AB34FCB4_9HYPO|nr:putative AC transposase [Purpureocillium lavendulum]